MNFTPGLTCILVALVTVHLTSGQLNDGWIKTAQNIGDQITINCSEYCANAEDNGCWPEVQIPAEYSEVVSWLGPAPTLYTWDVNSTDSTISEAECPSCEILDGGWTFRINSFDPKHVGIYHCMLKNESTDTYFMVKWGVNMKGPYFEDLLKKYEENIILGSSAFGGFILLAFTIMLVYKYRWVSDEDGKSRLPTSQSNYGSNLKYGVEPAVYSNVVDGKVNRAFEAESPPQYNGVKAQVEVHSSDDTARLGTSGSSSSSSSESGSMRRRDIDEETTHF